MVKKHKLEEITSDPSNDPDEDLIKALSILTSKQKIVLTHRFGLFGERAKTLLEVGNILKVTEQPVRQQQQKALIKLRHPSNRALVDKITHKNLRKAIFGD